MGPLEILLLALALSADAFSVGAALGLKHRSPRQTFRLAFHFGLFSPFSPVLSLLLLPLLVAVLVPGYLSVALVPLAPNLSFWVGKLAAYSAEVLTDTAQAFGKIGWVSWQIRPVDLTWVVTCYLALAAIALSKRLRLGPVLVGLAVAVCAGQTIWSQLPAGPPETADVYVDDGGGAVKCIEDAKLDGTLYQHGVSGYIDGADALRGLGIAFVVDPGDPTSKTFTLHVRDSSAWLEFAPDVSGSPGTWSSGPLTLTETDEVSGVITPSGQVHFWVRSVVPDSASPGDMRLHVYRVRGLTV